MGCTYLQLDSTSPYIHPLHTMKKLNDSENIVYFIEMHIVDIIQKKFVIQNNAMGGKLQIILKRNGCNYVLESIMSKLKFRSIALNQKF